jgi:hypothetical protein
MCLLDRSLKRELACRVQGGNMSVVVGGWNDRGLELKWRLGFGLELELGLELGWCCCGWGR